MHRLSFSDANSDEIIVDVFGFSKVVVLFHFLRDKACMFLGGLEFLFWRREEVIQNPSRVVFHDSSWKRRTSPAHLDTCNQHNRKRGHIISPLSERYYGSRLLLQILSLPSSTSGARSGSWLHGCRLLR